VVVALSGNSAAKAGPGTIRQLVSRISPDALIGIDPFPQGLQGAAPRDTSVPIFITQAEKQLEFIPVESSIGLITLPASGEAIRLSDVASQHQPTSEAAKQLPTPAACVITSEISLSISPPERSASLDGIEEYISRLPTELRGPSVTHLSTGLRVGFSTTYTQSGRGEDAIHIAGIGTSQANLGAAADNNTANSPAVIKQFSNGVTQVQSINIDAFGIQSLHGIGSSRADTLKDAQITTLTHLANTPPQELAGLSGIAATTAAAIHARATARVNNTVEPLGTDSLPSRDPVFIDIETDGLTPSTAWLIGVLDGGPEDGRYLTFREQNPGDGSHLEAFLMWLTGPAQNRPVVAWNGYNFDFPVIKDQLQKHYPERVSEWDNCYQFDALWWATDKDGGNVALPGRTNALEDVAEALGWTPNETGIDGATVAAIYSAYQAHETAPEHSAYRSPDWERLEAYCEDDVRALATIYEHLKDATHSSQQSMPTAMTTDQGSLSDFHQ
jgi:uncharacterized protein YprB with RNaseH-like and TPR domain